LRNKNFGFAVLFRAALDTAGKPTENRLLFKNSAYEFSEFSYIKIESAWNKYFQASEKKSDLEKVMKT